MMIASCCVLHFDSLLDGGTKDTHTRKSEIIMKFSIVEPDRLWRIIYSISFHIIHCTLVQSKIIGPNNSNDGSLSISEEPVHWFSFFHLYKSPRLYGEWWWILRECQPTFMPLTPCAFCCFVLNRAVNVFFCNLKLWKMQLWHSLPSNQRMLTLNMYSFMHSI